MMSRGGQSCLAWPLFRILGSRNCFSTSSMLQHSLKSRLCFLNTLRRFLEVDRTPLIRSCEFQAFSREGRAVSTLRPSSCLLRAATSRRLPSKLGVRMLRLEISAAMGLSRRGEGAQRWWERSLKKSGGSLELLMRMFLRRAKLWLRFGGRRGEQSLQNYMLEIQLFDGPSASRISCFHYIHTQLLPYTHLYIMQASFCYYFEGTAREQKVDLMILDGNYLQYRIFTGRLQNAPIQTQKTSTQTSVCPLFPLKYRSYPKQKRLIRPTLADLGISINHDLRLLTKFDCSNANYLILRIIIENQRKGPIMQEGKAATENTVSEREKMVEVKRKIGILKEALLTERQANRNLESQLYERGERLKKIELDSKKREEKNEALLLQIRTLKDALISERTQKQQAVQHLLELQRQEKEGGQGKKNTSSVFSWKGLFQK